ncbi:flavin reductase family protein [Streptomyces sp. NPDC047117]|uniref:flavin reductase family protein n=1 Tax=unclassified Streptomyces TaxID=2593676 RepID=UPI0033E55610
MTAPTHTRPHPLPGTAAERVPDAETLRRTLRRHAAGVTVVTVPGPAGFTATSFTSVSLDPPLVSFYLGRTASTVEAVRAADRFAVHVLGPQNAALAAQFARSGIDRFAGVPWTPADDGLPVLDAAPAWLTARITLRQTIGDHLLVVGQVDGGGGDGTTAGLVYQAGAFATPAALGTASGDGRD